MTATALTGVTLGLDLTSSFGISELEERATSWITAIYTYYPPCLSAERPHSHGLALQKLNGPLWDEGQRDSMEE